MPYFGLATDPYAGPDDAKRRPLALADNVNLSLSGGLVPRDAVQLAAPGPVAPVPEFFNFGRSLRVEHGHVYASALLDEDIPAELLYVYVGESPRLLWCTSQGTYVSVKGALLFLAGGDWPPQLQTVLRDDVLSTNVAMMPGVPRGYVLCRSGVYLLDAMGGAQQADNGSYAVPDGVVSVSGVVISDPVLNVDRVVFSESLFY
jgi:hypothetical protein